MDAEDASVVVNGDEACTNMKFRSVLLIALMLVLPSLSYAQTHALKFVKQIGMGWPPDKWGWMSFVSFSPDGTMVASDELTAGSKYHGSLLIWSFPEGRLMKKVPGAPEAMSSDWKYYATSKGVAETETGKTLISVRGDTEYVFSPDSRYVVESSSGGDAKGAHIRVIELATGKQVSSFGKHATFSLAISPDGVTLATGHWDVVNLWNMFTGQRVGVVRGFGRYVRGLSFSKDGKLLAGGTDFGAIQIWDVPQQRRLHSLKLEGSDVSDPAFSPDGRLLAFGIYGTGTVWLVDVDTGKLVDQQKVSDLGCGSVAFSPDGRFLIAPSTGGLIKWPHDRGGTVRVFEVNAP